MVDTLEHQIFGTSDGERIDDAIDRFCAERLGAGILEVLSRGAGVGLTLGARLADNRQVLVKVHQPRESRADLLAIHDVQSHLHGAGFPCPSPLLGPTVLGNGFAVVEEFVDYGDHHDTHEPKYRCLMAEALAQHLELTRDLSPDPVLAGGWNMYGSETLWPGQAHAPRFDLAANAGGTEWIDAIAQAAKPTAIQPTEMVIGHADWSGKHFRFNAGRVTVIYDWDSVRLRREAQIVGNAAMTFTTNYALDGVDRAPAPEEMRAFVDEYSAARSEPLTTAQRRQIAACATFIAAYTARCEHAAGDYDAEADPHSFTTALRMYGLDYLRA